MLKKLISVVILSVFSIGCFADEVIQCPKPTHTKGSPWQVPADWVIETQGPDNDMTEVPGDRDVVREYQDGWSSSSIKCTYNLSNTDKVVISRDFPDFVHDKTYQSYERRWLFSHTYYCTTKASTPGNCRLDIYHPSDDNVTIMTLKECGR
jgi:hypothetical protein